MKKFFENKSIGFYLSALISVIAIVNWIMYLMHVSDQINPIVAILLPVLVGVYVLRAIKPIPYLELVALTIALVITFFYLSVEADYISVCYVAIDASFTRPYLAQIGMTLVTCVLAVIQPIFKQER